MEKKYANEKDKVAKKNWFQFQVACNEKLPSIVMKSPVHPVSILDVPVAWGPLVSKEKDPDASQILYSMQQNPGK